MGRLKTSGRPIFIQLPDGENFRTCNSHDHPVTYDTSSFSLKIVSLCHNFDMTLYA